MQSFTFFSPTKVIFGKNAELKTAEEIKKTGASRVMIVYGGGSVFRSGLLDRIQELLDREDLPFTVLGGVKPNPHLSLARTGVRQALDFDADFILAVGGGSVIDTAKAIAHGAANPKTDIWSFWTREAELKRSLPIGVVLTISAAGSETSSSAVITNDETKAKRGLATEFNRPRFAVMNPELTYTLPREQITYGIVDIIMHTLDRYFTPVEGNELTDEIAESLLRVVIKNGNIALENTHDYEAMSELMWCGSISHNGLTGLGRPLDFAVHQLGHELSGRFDVAHGASLSTMWGAWAEYCFKTNPERFSRFGRKVWGIEEDSDEEAGLQAIEKMISYFKSIDAPTCFTELGIGKQDKEMVEDLADRCVFHGKRKVGIFMELGREEVYQIYMIANH